MPDLETTEVILRAIAAFRELDPEMPIGQAITLLVIAKYGPLSLKEVAERVDVGMATASRYVAAWGRTIADRGFNMVSAVEDPLERRKKIIQLTKRGEAFVSNLGVR